MTFSCPVCGKMSQDVEFCDFCNADLMPPPGVQLPSRCPITAEGQELTPEQIQGLYRPESSILIEAEGRLWRAHWIPFSEWSRYRPMIQERSLIQAASLQAIRVVEEPDSVWVFAETTGRHIRPWETPLANPPRSELHRLLVYAHGLAQAMEALHQKGLLTLRFDPREIEEVTDPEGRWSLRFTNFDLEVYRTGQYPEYLQLAPAFCAPETQQGRDQDLGPRTDVYHLALFCYYWLAQMLPDGFPGQGLDAFHYLLPSLRIYAPTLPPGIVSVLSRGLAQEPHQRFAGPGALVSALENAITKADQRSEFSGPIHWELGLHTRTGRAKLALGRQNEDSIFRKEFSDPPRAFVAVADGVTTCDIGSGALASFLTCVVFDNYFSAECRQSTFPEVISAACQHASQTLLDWALEKGHEQSLRHGMNLMGTTLNAAWLEGNLLHIANLGDSRAYLIDGPVVEQLTVDGDLGSGLLATRMPPENVRSMGSICKALRECIGGSMVTADNELIPLPDCKPTVTTWTLLPGDVVVLCTDGLVEEHIFLEPEILGEIVRTHGQLSAQELAVLLTDAADDLQRLPSFAEPDGYGDNISCIVIKITSAD